MQVEDAIEDFGDAAAIMASVDLVISSDTSVAHLAGAMGKPVWVLLQYDADWRWLLGRSVSPWPRPGCSDSRTLTIGTASLRGSWRN